LSFAEAGSISPVNWYELVLRLGLAVLVGAAIGWERESHGKPAGLRTHMLVSLGSAIFVLTGIQTGSAQASADVVARIVQGIVAGIGFLGAGEIFAKSQTNGSQEVIRIRGLTSAAATWVSAALGVAAACGLWVICLAGSLMSLLILWGVKKIE
jgi:putative Mg2+ transporter-C (MgtC) family protein